MLVRAPRTAGTAVASTATPRATAVTKAIVDQVNDGVPALPTRPELNSASNGALSAPIARPAAAMIAGTRCEATDVGLGEPDQLDDRQY